jgi:hypothetical protein
LTIESCEKVFTEKEIRRKQRRIARKGIFPAYSQ